MPDLWLIWLGAALLNLFIFIRIDWDVLRSAWTRKVWIVTMICCLIPPIGWGALITLWYQYRQGEPK